MSGAFGGAALAGNAVGGWEANGELSEAGMRAGMGGGSMDTAVFVPDVAGGIAALGLAPLLFCGSITIKLI